MKRSGRWPAIIPFPSTILFGMVNSLLLLFANLFIIYQSVRLYQKFTNRYFPLMAVVGGVTLLSPAVWNGGVLLALANFIANFPSWSITLVSIVELIPLFLTVYAAASYRESWQNEQPAPLPWAVLLAPVVCGARFWPAIASFLFILNSFEVLSFFKFNLGNVGYGGFLAVIAQSAAMLALVAAAVTELSLLRRYKNPFFSKLLFASLSALGATMFRTVNSLIAYVMVLVAPGHLFPWFGVILIPLAFGGWVLGLAPPVLTAYAFVTYEELAVERQTTAASTRFPTVHGDHSEQ